MCEEGASSSVSARLERYASYRRSASARLPVAPCAAISALVALSLSGSPATAAVPATRASVNRFAATSSVQAVSSACNGAAGGDPLLDDPVLVPVDEEVGCVHELVDLVRGQRLMVEHAARSCLELASIDVDRRIEREVGR